MGLIADLGRGALGVDTVIFLYFIEEQFPGSFHSLSRFSKKLATDAGSWLPRRLLCWKFWSFPIVRETTCWPSAMKLFSRGVAVFVLQRFRAIICAPLRS